MGYAYLSVPQISASVTEVLLSPPKRQFNYGDVRMGAITSQITNLKIVYSTIYSDADQNKHQSSASLAFERGIHRGPVNSPHKWLVTRKMFPFDDVIMLPAVPGITQLGGRNVILCWTGYPEELNTLRTTQNGRHFADDTFNSIFMNENVWL